MDAAGAAHDACAQTIDVTFITRSDLSRQTILIYELGEGLPRSFLQSVPGECTFRCALEGVDVRIYMNTARAGRQLRKRGKSHRGA